MLAENILPAREDIREFFNEVSHAWTADSSAYPEWSPELPEKGQCAVTALLVQERFGGDLMRAVVNGDSHYWNRLEDGTIVDFTRRQFIAPLTIEEESTRERDYLFSSPVTTQRYNILRANLA